MCIVTTPDGEIIFSHVLNNGALHCLSPAKVRNCLLKGWTGLSQRSVFSKPVFLKAKFRCRFFTAFLIRIKLRDVIYNIFEINLKSKIFNDIQKTDRRGALEVQRNNFKYDTFSIHSKELTGKELWIWIKFQLYSWPNKQIIRNA